MERECAALPSQDELKSYLSYDADTGELLWKPRHKSQMPCDLARDGWNDKFAGKPAGNPQKNRVIVSFRTKRYRAHRIIWKLVTGGEPALIDHRNRNPLDNRWSNLREADRSQMPRTERLEKIVEVFRKESTNIRKQEDGAPA